MSIILILLAITFQMCSSVSRCVSAYPPAIAIGNRAVVCVIIQLTNATYVYPFNVKIDKMSTLKVAGLANFLASQPSATLALQFQNSQQYVQVMLFNSSLSLSLPISSFIVCTSQGVYQSILFDNPTCNYCTASQICYMDTCYNKGAGMAGGDINLWVSWFGTDANGQHYLSHNSRLNRLAAYSLTNIYSAASSLIAV